MILSFSTQLNGKPTNFVEKIWKCFKTLNPEFHQNLIKVIDEKESVSPYPVDVSIFNNCMPKMHTIRKDEKNRWNSCRNIHFVINARQKNMKHFAPVLPVISTQKIEIKYNYFKKEQLSINKPFNVICTILIDDKFYGDAYFYEGKVTQNSHTLKPLFENDGFDSIDEFFEYFNTDFTGKIIHWTDLKY